MYESSRSLPVPTAMSSTSQYRYRSPAPATLAVETESDPAEPYGHTTDRQEYRPTTGSNRGLEGNATEINTECPDKIIGLGSDKRFTAVPTV